MVSGVGRRRFLEIVSSAAASAGIAPAVGCGDDDVPTPGDAGADGARDAAPDARVLPPPGRYLTSEEILALEAAATVVLPGDLGPGGAALGIPEYVDRLLSAFDDDPPRIWAAGPYSGRTPFPDLASGEPSDRFPTNDFARFVPLPPDRELAWRIRLFGSAATPGGAFNDAVLGATEGWRDLYRRGLAALDTEARSMGATRYADLDAIGRNVAFGAVRRVERELIQLVVMHTLEAAFAAPEYGGNPELAGWQSVGWGGDSLPQGYALPQPGGGYEELPATPTSTADPDDPFADLDAEVLPDVRLIVLGAGGQDFG